MAPMTSGGLMRAMRRSRLPRWGQCSTSCRAIGAQEGLAAVTASGGRMLASMPHPERVFRAVQNSWVAPAACAWMAVAALTANAAWSDTLGDTSPTSAEHCLVGTGVPIIGDCGPDPFYVASELLDAENVRHVVTGHIVSVAGLPDTLDEQVDVDVEFRIDGVRKPPARCPHPPRIDNKARCERSGALPNVVTLRIPGDWFLWAATGTSRRLARRGAEQLAALQELERERESGRVGEREHAEAKERLERELQRKLDWTTTVFTDDSSKGASAKDMPRVVSRKFRSHGEVRLLEDRRGHLEIGGEYLFALGDGVEGAAYTYYEPRKYHPERGWHVFWGDEMRDVEIALMLIGNCMRSEPPLFAKETSAYLCGFYSRGLATFRLYPELPRWRFLWR